MTPQVPDDPSDRALEEAMTRSRAKTMIDQSHGFLVLSYGPPSGQQKGGMFDGEFCFWGAPAPFMFLYQLWLNDTLKLFEESDDESTG